ncbi:MAG: hypothetical protein JXB38_00195 [Anaerolineales bacterium]|nr:hypothetical protein [Anaerolineales bacterium]
MNACKHWGRKLPVVFALLILITATFINVDTAQARSATTTDNSQSTSTGTFTATKKDNKLYIEVKNFDEEANLNVRARPADGSSGWQKIGSLSTDKEGDGEETITLTSSALKKADQLSVCLKNIDDDSLSCTVTGSTTTTSTGSSSSSASAENLSARLQGERLIIQAEDFPTKTTYFVRVKPTNSTLRWEKIGSLSTDNNGNGKATIALETNALKNANQLSVCLKDTEDDSLTCTTTGNTTSSTSSSSGSSSIAALNFTAAIQSNRLVIQIKDAPASESFYVFVHKSSSLYTGNWDRIGVLTVKNDGKISKTFQIDSKYREADVLHVSLKSTSTTAVYYATIYP